MKSPRQALLEEIQAGHAFLAEPEFNLDAAAVIAVEMGIIRRLIMLSQNVYPAYDDEELADASDEV